MSAMEGRRQRWGNRAVGPLSCAGRGTWLGSAAGINWPDRPSRGLWYERQLGRALWLALLVVLLVLGLS